MLTLKSLEKSSAHEMALFSDCASHAAVNAAPVILPLTVSTISGPCCAQPECLPAAAGSPPSAASPLSADSSLPAVGPVPFSPLAPLASEYFSFSFRGYHRNYHQSNVSHLLLGMPYK